MQYVNYRNEMTEGISFETYSWKKYAFGKSGTVIGRPGFGTLAIKGPTSGQG